MPLLEIYVGIYFKDTLLRKQICLNYKKTISINQWTKCEVAP